MFNPDPTLVTLLQATVSAGASDLAPHRRPAADGSPRRCARAVRGRAAARCPTETERIVMSLLNDGAAATSSTRTQQVDFSFGIDVDRSFPCQRLSASATATRSPCASFPSACVRSTSSAHRGPRTELLQRPYGLVLVVGPTGSGKSTTLAAMIDRINETRPVHILTIEDPVEYLHHHKVAMVNQREVGTDVDQLHRRPAQRTA